MKNIIVLSYFTSTLLLCSCNSEFLLRNNSKKFISLKLQNTDTIYVYSVAFNDFELAWYHKDEMIQAYIIRPLTIKKLNPIVALNFPVNDSTIYESFSGSLFKDVKCFEDMLDGELIELYTKGGNKFTSSINTQCLFEEQFEKRTIQNKLKYDLSLLMKPSILNE